MRVLRTPDKHSPIAKSAAERKYFACDVVTCIESCHDQNMVAQVWKTWRWDGLGLGIAGLCLVHCIATTILLTIVASVGGVLLNPIIHEIGLLFAIIFGIIALGKGFRDHRVLLPTVVGSVGIAMMGGALMLPHGGAEILWTIFGVSVLSIGHVLNFRASR
jgi:hypothetical protein